LGFLGFFSPGAPEVFLREGYAGYVTPCKVLIVVLITSFLPSLRGLEFSLFDGDAETLLSHSGEHWVSVHCGGQASCNREVDYHSVEEL
jgi:hypothetical protein